MTDVVHAAAWYKMDTAGRAKVGVGYKSLPGAAPIRDSKKLAALCYRNASEAQVTAIREALKANNIDPDAPDRLIPWTISTPRRDRDGDRILSIGALLKDYKNNPIVLYNHNRHGFPAGSSVRVWKSADAVKAIGMFPGPEVAGGFPYAVYQFAKALILRASSIGFMPKEWEKDPEMTDAEKSAFPWGGFLHKKWELLEWSPVTIPSNPDALQAAKSLGADVVRAYSTVLSKALDNDQDPMGAAMRAFADHAFLARCWGVLTERTIFSMSTKNHNPAIEEDEDQGPGEDPAIPERDDNGDERKDAPAPATPAVTPAPVANDEPQIKAGGMLVAAAKMIEHAEDALAHLEMVKAQAETDAKKALGVLYRAQDMIAASIAKIEGVGGNTDDADEDDNSNPPTEDFFELGDD